MRQQRAQLDGRDAVLRSVGGRDGATNSARFRVECSTRYVPGPGQCQWCNHATGTWYPVETRLQGEIRVAACERQAMAQH
ncbi:MAG: hypothetical protein U0168_21820 [Nannocystaceae bacterium]